MNLNGVRSRQLLLVEDNPGDADLIMELLAEPKKAPDRIVHVPTLGEAIARLQALAVDAVLLDLRLPDGFGVECVAAIRAEAGEVPIVVLTGIDDDDLALSCIGAGAQDYLSKQEVRTPSLRRSIGYAIARVAEKSERTRADTLQDRLAAIVEASSDAIVSSTVDGLVTSWNMGAERTFGYTSAEALGKPVRSVMRPADGDGEAGPEREILQARDGVTKSEAREIERLRKDGSAVTLSVVSSALHDATGQVVGLAAICRDITESKRRDESLRKMNEELIARGAQMRALTARLNSVREEERTRISREVHDELGQLLTGLKMDLRWMERRLNVDSELALAIGPRLMEAEKLVDQTIETVQRIAVELRPSALDALGLAAAIRDEARRFQLRTSVVVEVEAREHAEPDKEIATTIFRIFQELLTNVARHARAKRLRILLEDDGSLWKLRVEDDGIGIPPEEERRSASLGLLGIKERAESLGGTVLLQRGARRGTVATVEVPARSSEG